MERSIIVNICVYSAAFFKFCVAVNVAFTFKRTNVALKQIVFIYESFFISIVVQTVLLQTS